MKDQQPINFSFTPEEAETIRYALGKLPHDDVQGIVIKMYQTVEHHVFGDDDQTYKRTRKPRKTKEAPYGHKKDGTPKKRPGRPAK
jgi:hypothetical protein